MKIETEQFESGWIGMRIMLTQQECASLRGLLHALETGEVLARDPPNDMPRFYEGGSHQGVQRRIYPYPMNDGLTDVKEDQPYHVVRLENEYIDLGIMPGMGGRIYWAVDKTNGYEWFYRNAVVKPSLIGMVGYWVSGSNAWGRLVMISLRTGRRGGHPDQTSRRTR